jgi:hypothetical protein
MSMGIATHNKPCASPNLHSFRYRGRYGWIMIGAHDALDALREASRSTGGSVSIKSLQEWNGESYANVA